MTSSARAGRPGWPGSAVTTLAVMRRLLSLAVASLLLVAATPREVVSELVANGYYIESGSDVSEQVVSDAVFEGRAAGGRLYLVVLSEDPPGGATTFSDSTLDLLEGGGYVVTIAPQTVGFAGDGSFWSVEEMNDAVDSSLEGGSDTEVVELFIGTLTGGSIGGGADDGPSGSSGGGAAFLWILLIAGGLSLVLMFVSRRGRAKRASSQLEQVRTLAREKLNEVANDILEMEDEVAVSESHEVREHYARASAIYTTATDAAEKATTVQQMMKVGEDLDTAIWELDSAEAILDGKPKPPRPEPPQPVLPLPAPPSSIPPGGGDATPIPSGAEPVPEYDRRPQRRSSGSNDLMTMLMTMMAMRGMSRGRGGGFFGGGSPGGWAGGGGRGGGFRTGGGGRFRGGGRRGG